MEGGEPSTDPWRREGGERRSVREEELGEERRTGEGGGGEVEARRRGRGGEEDGGGGIGGGIGEEGWRAGEEGGGGGGIIRIGVKRSLLVGDMWAVPAGVTPAEGKGVAVGGGASQGCTLTKLEDSVSPGLACGGRGGESGDMGGVIKRETGRHTDRERDR